MTRILLGGWVLVCGLGAGLGEALADDWPQWFGPRRDSVWRETGIVQTFPSSGPPVRWRVPVAGGYAGPAVAEGRVYVMDYVTSGDRTGDPNSRSSLQGEERVLCFSETDGRLLWKHAYERSYDISYPAGPRATPTVDGDRVYTLGAEGDLLCLAAEDGRVVWSRYFPRDYQAETALWGCCSHPLIVDDLLFCLVGGSDSVVVAFDKHTGKEVWRALSAKEPGYSAPALIHVDGQPQLAIWHAESINGLDPETGRLFWSVSLDPAYGMSIATPRQSGSYLFAGGIVNKSVLLRLSTTPPLAEVLWQGRRNVGIGPVMVTPFLQDGYLYGVDGKGELRCVELATGEQLWTSYAATTGGDRGAHSACAFLVKQDDRFFLASETGDLIIAQLSPEGYTEVSRAKIIEPTSSVFGRNVWWSHPAFANRCVYARNDRELICISLSRDDRPMPSPSRGHQASP